MRGRCNPGFELCVFEKGSVAIASQRSSLAVRRTPHIPCQHFSLAFSYFNFFALIAPLKPPCKRLKNTGMSQTAAFCAQVNVICAPKTGTSKYYVII